MRSLRKEELKTFKVEYRIDVFPCKTYIKALTKEEADEKFVRQFGEIPLQITLAEDEE